MFRVDECRRSARFKQRAHIKRTDIDAAIKAVMRNCRSDTVIASSYPTQNKNVCCQAKVRRCDRTIPGLKGFIKYIQTQFTQPDDEVALDHEEATRASSQGQCDSYVLCPGVLLFNLPAVYITTLSAVCVIVQNHRMIREQWTGKYVTGISNYTFKVWMHKFCKSHFKISGVRSVTWRTFNAQGPQILGVAVQNLVAIASKHLGFDFRWHHRISLNRLRNSSKAAGQRSH
jgi:hypothetical protein